MWTLRQWGEPLPELQPSPIAWTEEQKRRIDLLDKQVNADRNKIAAAELEMSGRRADWQRQLREQAKSNNPSLQEGLIAHYPFDLSEDMTTQGAVEGQPNGQYVGDHKPRHEPGVLGGAVRLDGEAEYFSCGDVVTPEWTDTFSYGCWFFAETETRGALFSKFSDVEQSGFAVNIDPTRGYVLCEFSRGYPKNALDVIGNSNNLSGRWHHLLIVYDGSSKKPSVKLYLDGDPMRQSITKNNLSKSIQVSTSFQIGIRDTSFPFGGLIDDVRLYGRRLSDEDVRQLHAEGVRALGSTPAENRTPDQRAHLAAEFHKANDAFRELSQQVVASETALRDAIWKNIRRWHVNSESQVMVLVRNPERVVDRSTNRTVAIGRSEVTVAEFARSARQIGWGESVDPNVARSEDCPVHHVDWFFAASYCNWLSRQEGIPRDQWVFEPNSNGDYDDGMTIKPNALELTGYRLPTQEEWERACSPGTRGTYFFGEPLELLDRYAHYALSSSGRTHPVESLLPNGNGLFGLYGNVWEWTLYPRTRDGSIVRSNLRRVLCGGCFNNQALGVSTSSHYEEEPTYFSHGAGFRLARTLPIVELYSPLPTIEPETHAETAGGRTR